MKHRRARVSACSSSWKRRARYRCWRVRLRANGYTVSAAQSGTAALQAIEAGLPDLVLMEAEMSLMTGVRTLSALLDAYAGPRHHDRARGRRRRR